MKPNEAIKRFCNWCSGNSPQEAELCIDRSCPLFDIRACEEEYTLLLAMRKLCVVCCGRDEKEPARCKEKKCAMWKFRLGPQKIKRTFRRKNLNIIDISV